MSQGILELNAPEFHKAWKSGSRALARWSIKQLAWSTAVGAAILILVSLLSSWGIMAIQIIPSPLWIFGVIFWGAIALLANWIYECKDMRVAMIATIIIVPLAFIVAGLQSNTPSEGKKA